MFRLASSRVNQRQACAAVHAVIHVHGSFLPRRDELMKLIQQQLGIIAGIFGRVRHGEALDQPADQKRIDLFEGSVPADQLLRQSGIGRQNIL